MILRYLDTHPDHRHLWQNLDSRFLPMVPAMADPLAYEQALERYLYQQLAAYQGEEPVLLIWHVHEDRLSQQGLWRLSRELWLSWPAQERIYCLLVSGGGANAFESVIQSEQLPPRHVHALAEPLPQELTDDIRQRWRLFLDDFETQAQPNWDLLTPHRSEASHLVDLWRSWRHDLLLCLQAWPERQGRAQAHWQQLPRDLSKHLPADWQAQIQTYLFKHPTGSFERDQIETLLHAAQATFAVASTYSVGSYSELEAQGWSREQAQRLLRHWEHLRQQWQALKQEHTNHSDWPDELAASLTDLFQRLPDTDQARAVQILAQDLRQLASQLAAMNPAPRLRQILHNGIEQSLYYLASELAHWSLDSFDFASFKAWLQDWPVSSSQPSAPLAKRTLAGVYEKVNVLIVEDYPLWQQDVQTMCQDVIEDLGCRKHIRSFQCTSDLVAARQALQAMNHQQAALLVILDLSFPPDAGQEASRQSGISLLQELTNYHQQATVIVFSTPRWLLHDQRVIQSCGVPDSDYVLKSEAAELPEVIGGWLERLLYKPIPYTLEIQRDPQADTGQVLFNQVPVKLERTLFQFLFALADLHQHTGGRQGVSAEGLIRQVESLFSRFQRPESLQEWPEHLNDSCQSLDARLDRVLLSLPLQDHSHQISLRNQLLQQARIWLQDPNQSLCPGLKKDQELLHLLVERYESLDSLKPMPDFLARLKRFLIVQSEWTASTSTLGSYVSDQIYQLRQHFHQQLRAAGQAIRINECIISKQTEGYGTRYALAPQVKVQLNALKPSQAGSRALCVWLIENDSLYIDCFQQAISSYGLECVVLPHLQAVRDALQAIGPVGSGPDLIILDLHIPEDAQAYAEDPLSGQEDFGLYALNEIQMLYPDIRTLVVSAFSDRDDLRVLARKLNHLNQVDFVSKGFSHEADWLALFHRQFQRVLSQFESPLDQMLIPPCVVTIESYQSEPRAQLQLCVNDAQVVYQGIQAQCMKLLLDYHGQWVPTELFIRELYQADPDFVDVREYDEKMKQLRKQLRDKIYVSWFEQQVPKKAIQASVLSSQRFGGTRLQVHQLVDPQGVLGARTVLTP